MTEVSRVAVAVLVGVDVRVGLSAPVGVSGVMPAVKDEETSVGQEKSLFFSYETRTTRLSSMR
jgi:hypothetical protein